MASLPTAVKIAVLKLGPVGMLWSLKACFESITEGHYGSCCTHRTSKGHWRNAGFTDIKSKILTDIHRAMIFQSLAATCTWMCFPLCFRSREVTCHFPGIAERGYHIFHQILSKKKLGTYWYGTFCVLFTPFNAHIPAQSSVSRIRNLLTRTVLG